MGDSSVIMLLHPVVQRFDSPRPRGLGRMTAVAYDGYLHSTTAVATAVSYPSLDSLIGAFDQVAVEVIVDRTRAGVGPVSLDVHLGHSGNGLLWVRKDKNPLTSTEVLSLTGKTYLETGYDDGAKPSLGFVRMELTLSAALGPVGAWVQVSVTGNNLSEHQFSLSMQGADRPSTDTYDRCYSSGSRIAMIKIKDLITYWRYFNQFQVDMTLGAAVVPRDQMVCFNAYGDYILLDQGRVAFSSRGVLEYYIEEARRHRGQGPNRKAEDPKPDVKMKWVDDDD